ncbi:MAG TPA: ATP-binding protein [Gemmatimonadales bacterium]|nr:ATP-binding protein [Gemmatimonadales bacterium]
MLIPVGIAAFASAAWLRAITAGNGLVWAGVTGVAGLASLALVLRARGDRGAAGSAVSHWAAAGAAVATGAVLIVSSLSLWRVECCWARLRERRVSNALEQLEQPLSDAVADARRLAASGASAVARSRNDAFTELRRAARTSDPGFEHGVLVLGRDGAPWAWAGRHRFVPALDTAELRAVITPFYVSLEARRQTGRGEVAVGTVLLDATLAAPEEPQTLAASFARTHGVTLRFLPPHLAPPGSDVSDYALPGGDTLFSVQVLPPTQGDARIRVLDTGLELGGALLVLILVALFAAAPPGPARWVVALASAWCLAAVPLGVSGKLAALFSPVTFYRRELGIVSSSTGALTLVAVLLVFAGAALWRAGLPRRWWSWGIAAVLILAAPYLARNLARGITPPARGAGFGLWLSWEISLAVASMALILLAAALVRGRAEAHRVPWPLPVACGCAAAVAALGLWLWGPNDAWPEWYTYLWTPALAGVLVPAPRRATIIAIATVAGTAATLLTWGASIEGRVALADRDARGLGNESDPLAAALLERLSVRVVGAAALPRTAGGLYGIWLGSPLAREGYPTTLSLWTKAGDPEAELSLASLNLPTALVAALVRSPATAQGARVERVPAVPGVHYVLIAPLPDGDVLAVGVGPRSRLVPPTRVERFLEGEYAAIAPYTISVSPPGDEAATPRGQVEWRRDGWSARGERLVAFPGGTRHVHLRVDLRGPWPLLVRGMLVVFLDVLLLAGLWVLGAIMTEGITLHVPSIVSGFRTSYRVRVAGVLAGLLVIPVLAFGIWGFARTGDEARAAGDLLIRQALKDAALASGELPVERDAAQRGMLELASRLDADLWLYRDGVLTASSTPALDELGLVDRFLTPRIFTRLALADELDAVANGRSAGRSIRIGYRVVGARTAGDEAILAAPQLLDDEAVQQQEEDLALTVLLLICLASGAAISVAGLAAGALARPVAALERAAIAVGAGDPPPPFPERAFREFGPVMNAFQQMAADVRSSRASLEQARHRMAQVLANVATGVIAVDADLRIALANQRAVELLGALLEQGSAIDRVTGGEWQPVWALVRKFQRLERTEIEDHEVTVDSRQIRVQLAPLGPVNEARGSVIALDDVTDRNRAARVLAWGEMARQVAHEIKNPLTPIRLGIQHLQRVRHHGDFDATLQDTAARILAEIDRLDAIARTFSRFGTPATQVSPLEPLDLYELAQEIVQLYSLGSPGGKGKGQGKAATGFHLEGAPGARVLARRDEVKEVLVNLLENARNAEARRVTVQVAAGGRELSVIDDGRGIPAELLPRVFEPAFSTTSSGAGLGLAIAKRLVDGWGGTITITSSVGVGTTVRIVLPVSPEEPRQTAA